MPKIPIPDDWNGQAWTNVCVAWPNSTKYLALLNGLLSYLTRGRIYDETTGNIKEAQEIGWEIWRRNQPFQPCGDSLEAPETPGLGTLPCFDGELFEEECEEDMSTNGPCPPLKIEGGKLYWWQCCEWLEVGSMDASQTQDSVPPDMWEQGETPPTYHACGKAYAVWTVINRTGEAIWEASEDVPVWNILGYVEGEAGYNLSNNWVADGVVNVQLAQVGGVDKATFLDATKLQTILCHLVEIWGDDAIGVPDDDTRNAIWGVYRTNTSWLESAIWNAAINALGRGTLNNVAVLSSTDGTRDCDCVSEPQSPVRWGTPAASNLEDGDTVTFLSDLSGKRVKVTWNISSHADAFRDFTLAIPLIVPAAGDQIKIKLERISGNAPTEEWSDEPCPNSDPTLWMAANVEGPGPGDWTPVITAEDGAQIIEYTYVGGEVPTQWHESSVRECPKAGVSTTVVFRLTITEWENNPI